MTSQVISSMPSVGLRYPTATAPAVLGHGSEQVGAGASWRRRGSVKTFVGLCWVLGTCASFLTVGVVGMFAADVPWYELKTLEALAEVEELDMTEAAMAELQSEATPEEQLAEEPAELPTEITEVIETPQEVLDLPELVEAMTLEDIFAIPTAPRIEDPLRPVDPVVKPRPKPTPAKPRTTVAKAGGGTGASTGRAGMVGGVAGGVGTGTGNGRLIKPQPPYPSFARSAGMQGTVRLQLNFGVSGWVESASVISSTGYSALDNSAMAYVQRKWHYQGGLPARMSRSVPITFRLH